MLGGGFGILNLIVGEIQGGLYLLGLTGVVGILFYRRNARAREVAAGSDPRVATDFEVRKDVIDSVISRLTRSLLAWSAVSVFLFLITFLLAVGVLPRALVVLLLGLSAALVALLFAANLLQHLGTYKALRMARVPGEQVIATGSGRTDSDYAKRLRSGCTIAATNRRLLVGTWGRQVNPIPYDELERFELVADDGGQLVIGWRQVSLTLKGIPHSEATKLVDAVASYHP